jgi:uncharacterized protein YjiS (DUF1127 family)
MTQMTATTATKSIRFRTARPQPAGFLARFFAAWKQRRQKRRDEMWLTRQPDHLLRDIGISRGEIEAIISHGRYR